MIDMILMLIDQLIKLVHEKQRTDSSLFKNFVEPMIDQFDKVHSDYIDAFRKYRYLIENESCDLNNNHPVFSEIEEDQIFSMHLRQKLYLLNNSLFSVKSHTASTLVHAVISYIMDGSDIDDHDVGRLRINNVSRIMLHEGLTHIANGKKIVWTECNPELQEKKVAAVFLIEKRLEFLQRRYEDVYRAYQEVKQALV